MDTSSLSHTKWDCTYYIVFIPKYRQKVMCGELRTDIQEILKKLCEYKDVAIVEGSVSFRSCAFMCKNSTQVKCLRIYGILKRKSALMIFDKRPVFV